MQERQEIRSGQQTLPVLIAGGGAGVDGRSQWAARSSEANRNGSARNWNEVRRAVTSYRIEWTRMKVPTISKRYEKHLVRRK
jgi:hypothetical protein